MGCVATSEGVSVECPCNHSCPPQKFMEDHSSFDPGTNTLGQSVSACPRLKTLNIMKWTSKSRCDRHKLAVILHCLNLFCSGMSLQPAITQLTRTNQKSPVNYSKVECGPTRGSLLYMCMKKIAQW